MPGSESRGPVHGRSGGSEILRGRGSEGSGLHRGVGVGLPVAGGPKTTLRLTIPERFGFGSPLGNGVNFHEKRGKGTSLISTVSEGKERDFLRCGGQARTVSPVGVTAVRGSQLTYCVEVAAELLADVEEQTVRGSDPFLSAHAAIPVVVVSACLSR